MRARLRKRIHRRPRQGPGSAPRQVWQLAFHAGAEYQERLRRFARFSEPALDGVFQVSGPLAGRPAGARIDQRDGAEAARSQPTISCSGCATNCITRSTGRAMFSPRACSHRSRHNLGYTDRSPSKRLERFMRDVYKHIAQHLLDYAHGRAAPGPAAGAQALPSLRALLRTGRTKALPAAGRRIHVRRRRSARFHAARLSGSTAPAHARLSLRAAARAAIAPGPGAAHSATTCRW